MTIAVDEMVFDVFVRVVQDIDQMALFKPIVKYAATCDTVRDIIPTLRKAFQVRFDIC